MRLVNGLEAGCCAGQHGWGVTSTAEAAGADQAPGMSDLVLK